MITQFALGHVVTTPGAFSTFPPEFLASSLVRHARGDWGDLDAEDKAANEAELRTGGRLLSVYELGVERLYIITEHDRSATTLLLPSEY